MRRLFARVALVMLALLTVGKAQTLHDVVISLTDRQSLLTQRDQVRVYLHNQNNQSSAPDESIVPIQWLGGIGANPTPSAVDALSIGDKIALLNQAIGEFDRLKYYYLNSSEDEYASGKVVGTLRKYHAGDFAPLPRATPENYQKLLSLLAQRVLALRVISWPVTYNRKDVVDRVAYYREGEDWQNQVKIYDEMNNVAQPPVNWLPSVIAPRPEKRRGPNYNNPLVDCLDASDIYFHCYYEVNANSHRTQRVAEEFFYPSDADICISAPAGMGESVDGEVYVLSRSRWNEFTIEDISPEFDSKEGGYVVRAFGKTGTVPLLNNPPKATIHGEWVGTTPPGASPSMMTFVEGGYKYRKASVLPLGFGHTDDHDRAYESYWLRPMCDFMSIFKPSFVRGVDGLAAQLEFSNRVQSDNTADGAFCLHPRPSLLFGIDLGPGLKGAGNGYIASDLIVGDAVYDWYNYYYHFNPRFDSSYSIRLAGSCLDYHVVHENDRSKRTQKLPDFMWPITINGEAASDFFALGQVWDSPRLKQVVGRDLVANIEYNSCHYGGYTVNIYRRPMGSPDPQPGELLPTEGLLPIRSWAFSNPGVGTEAHPESPEKLLVLGNHGEKYEIMANHALPMREDAWTRFEGYTGAWWMKYGGTWSWTLKLTQGTAEKFKKDIKIITTAGEDEYEDNSSSVVSVEEYVDGQLVSSLSSNTLDPFSDKFPSDWEITAAGKTIKGSASVDKDDPATAYGRFPSSVSIDYAGLQPNASYAWDAQGLLASASQGAWSVSGSVAGGVYQLQKKFNGTTYATTWTELTGNILKTYSAPDGTVAGKSAPSVAWSELEYSGGLPKAVRHSDGTGTTFDWATGGGGYTLTQESGVLVNGAVSRGTRQVRAVNARGFPVSVKSFAKDGAEIQTGGTTYGDFTAWGAPQTATDFTSGLASAWTYDGGFLRLTSHQDYLGLSSSIGGYDALGRAKAVTANGITATHTYAGLNFSSAITGAATGSIVANRDGLGRTLSSSTTWNGLTASAGVVYAGDGSATVHQTHGLFGTHDTTLDPAGALASASGTTLPSAVNGSGLSIEAGVFKQTSTNATGGLAQTTWTDAWGRVRKVQGTDGKITQTAYSLPSEATQRMATSLPGGTVAIRESNAATGATREGLDRNGDGVLGAGDRYVESVTGVSDGGVRTIVSATDAGGFREVARSTWTPSSGVTQTSLNSGEEVITATPDFAQKKVKTESSKGWTKNQSFNSLGKVASAEVSGTGVAASDASLGYDAGGRLASLTSNSAGATTAASWKADGTLASLTLPGITGNALGGHSIGGGAETLTIAGRTRSATLNGLQQSESGTGTWANTVTTALVPGGFTRTLAPATGGATVETYNAAGAETQHAYPAGAATSFARGDAGEVTARNEGSGAVNYDYAPDGSFDLTGIHYPAVGGIAGGEVTITRGAAGEATAVSDAAGTCQIGYTNGRATSESYTSGALKGYAVERTFSNGRQDALAIRKDGQVVGSVGFGYNGTSDELLALSAGGATWSYGRDSSSRAVISLGNGSVAQSWGRDGLGRAVSAASNVAGASAVTGTTFDNLGRRQSVATSNGTWTYGYQGDGQLALASLSGTGAYTYNFDGIGVRTAHDVPGGGGPFLTSANALHQPVGVQRRQSARLTMSAHPQASVKIDGQPVTPFLGSAWKDLTTSDPAGGWVPWNVEARLSGGGVNGSDRVAKKQGWTWLPPAQETLSYTAAGQLAGDSQWVQQWDGLGRLAQSSTRDYLTAPEGFVVSYAYDAQGRRFRKQVSRYEAGVLKESKEVLYVWDGWDLAYERSMRTPGGLEYERSYAWGLDLSGSRGGAGGAGGLVAMIEKRGTITTTYVPLYDTAGNVTGMADGNGQLVASYQWGPFGEAMMAAGPLAERNPFRWETKYFDEETGLYYFGHRYYDSVSGTWLSREPLGEKESINLDVFAHNDPVNNVDAHGLESVPMYRNQIAQAQGRMGLAEYAHWLDGMAAENHAAKWSKLFSGAEAAGQQIDPKLIAAVSFLHASGAEARAMARNAAMGEAGATIDVANAGINRLYRHAAYLDWAACMEPGSIDPTVDPKFFDDDNPEFLSAEWSRRLVQINPSKNISRYAVNGQYGAASLEFGKEVAICSAFGLAGEYVTAGRVTFGVGLPTGRNMAAMSIRNFRRDMRAAGVSTADVNGYVQAFELPSFRYGRNFNPFRKYFRHFTAGERAGGSWVHPNQSLLSADSLTRRTLLALPESNLATGTAMTRIPLGSPGTELEFAL